MPAGRTAHGSNFLRIDAEAGAVRAQESDRRFYIVNRRREGRGRS